MKTFYSLLITLILFVKISVCQNVGINTTGAAPAATNLLEVLSTSTTANSVGIYSEHSGAVAGTGYGILVSKTGASTTNIAGSFSASGATNNTAATFSTSGAHTTNTAASFSATDATNNYAIIVPPSSGNVGIGTSTPSTKAILELNSTTQGILIPRLTTTERNAIASPPTGLMIYNTTINCFEIYNSSSWNCLGYSSPSSISCSVAGGTATATTSTGACGTSTTLVLTGATGTSYQWQRSSDNSLFVDITGATTCVSNTTINAATSASASHYIRCKVSDGSCIAYSNVLTLTSTNASNTYCEKSSLPSGTGRMYAVAFSIGTKGYVGTGVGSGTTLLKDFWEYDPTKDLWTQRANYGGSACYAASGFASASKGYIGGGYTSWGVNTSFTNSFYEYDPSTNAWTAKANITVAKGFACGAFDGTYGYIIAGAISGGTMTNTNYRYDPTGNTWATRTAISTARYNAVAFAIGATIYVGTGANGAWYSNGWDVTSLSSFQKYTNAGDTWSAVTALPSAGSPEARIAAFAFSDGTYGYVGSGATGGSGNIGYNNVYRYNPGTDTWTAMTSMSGWTNSGYRGGAVAFYVSGKAYIGFGISTEVDGDPVTDTYYNDLYQYYP